MIRASSFIDILIPSYRGERYLPLCLTALARSSFRSFKVYVAIEGSFQNLDFVYHLVRSLSLPVEFVNTGARIGLAKNRRRLLRMGESNLILWLDDDVLVGEDALHELMKPVSDLGENYSIITGVGSNLYGCPKVACGLGLTLCDRRLLVGDKVLCHEFNLYTGEDWLWTARIVYKTGLPVEFVPVAIHHVGESRRRKRYTRQWDSSMFVTYTSTQFYEEHKEELKLSYPVYNYLDY
jgi:glycosyltransferase involved in cell wall biosynthesis